MNPSEPVPRINGDMLKHHVGRTVCLLGRVVGEKQSQAPHGFVLQTSDGVDVIVSQAEATESKFVELRARVEPDLTLTAVSTVPFGDDFGWLWFWFWFWFWFWLLTLLNLSLALPQI